MGEKQPQIFQIDAPQDLTIKLDVPTKTLMNLGVSKDRICKELGISNKTLSNILSGQQVSYSLMDQYIELFQQVCIERKLSLEDFNSSNLESGSVADELKALIDRGWTVPKIAHELGKSERQVYRWLESANCKREFRLRIKSLIADGLIFLKR